MSTCSPSEVTSILLLSAIIGAVALGATPRHRRCS
jgi:NADH:ubiquinone oxidoreductase subunit 6 (subunit J)